jgi:hypothetical protein
MYDAAKFRATFRAKFGTQFSVMNERAATLFGAPREITA